MPEQSSRPGPAAALEALSPRVRARALASLSPAASALGLETPATWYDPRSWAARQLAAELRPRRYFLRPRRELRAAPDADGGACAICLDALRAGDLVRPMLSCQHAFHADCVRELMESARRRSTRESALEHLACPVCRGRMLASSLAQVPEQESGRFRAPNVDMPFLYFRGFPETFGNFAVFRTSPRNLCVVFKQRSESPHISAKLALKARKKQLKKSARKISQSCMSSLKRP